MTNAGRQSPGSRTEEALRQAEERLYSVMRHAPIVVWTLDRDGVFTLSEGRGLEALGLRPGEVVGRSVFEVYADYPEVLADARRALDGQVVTSTVAIGPVAFDLRYTPLWDPDQRLVGTIGVAMDITSRTRVEQALRRSEAEYRDLVEHSPLGIYRSTPDGRFLSVNPALVEMLGYASAEDLMAVDLAQNVYVDPDDRQALLEQFAEAEVVGGLEAVRWKRKDGTELVAHLTGRIVRDPEGAIRCFEMVVEDVTERRHLEAQLRQAQKMEEIGQLTGGIAHDLKNLLSVILLNSQAVKSALDAGSAVDRTDIENIENAAQNAAEMITRLLGFSRRADLAPVPTDLARVVAGLSSMLRRILPENIKIEITSDTPVVSVKADPRAVEQMILNLATNARDAMPEGGTLRIAVEQTTLDDEYVAAHVGAQPGEHVRVSVSDTGVGMTEDTRRRVFEPFFTTKPPGQGTGLGLAMVYGLTKQQRGFVDIASDVGRGTVVHLYFPGVADAAQSPTKRMFKELVRGGGETILLVEDDAALRRSAKRVLEAHGYTVVTAEDGVAALEYSRAHPGTIDLVVSDLVMPRMSGPQLYEALGKEGGPVKFVLCSGYGVQAMAERQVIDPAIPLVPKPWELSELLVTIRSVLDS